MAQADEGQSDSSQTEAVLFCEGKESDDDAEPELNNEAVAAKNKSESVKANVSEDSAVLIGDVLRRMFTE